MLDAATDTSNFVEIIDAVRTVPGIVSLVILVATPLAMPMTKGVNPNLRAAIFIFLVLTFLVAGFMAFRAGERVQHAGFGNDAPPQTETADTVPEKAENMTDTDERVRLSEPAYRAVLIDQEVAEGFLLPMGTTLKLKVTAIGDNSCSINIKGNDRQTLASHEFSQPGSLAFDNYVVRFTQTGHGIIKKTCHFDIQELVAAGSPVEN